jgi:hypothetical protein
MKIENGDIVTVAVVAFIVGVAVGVMLCVALMG